MPIWMHFSGVDGFIENGVEEDAAIIEFVALEGSARGIGMGIDLHQAHSFLAAQPGEDGMGHRVNAAD